MPDVRIIRHGENRGYGAALKSGMTAARGELIAFLDADGTYPPESLPGAVRGGAGRRRHRRRLAHGERATAACR